MKYFLPSKGFTLVELLVSMAVLSILIVAFTTFFSWHTINIFENGEKSKAIAKAETKLENIYLSLSTEGYDYKKDIEYESAGEVFKYKNRERNFSVKIISNEDGKVKGYEVTVVVFYQRGERYVTIVSYKEDVPKGGT